MNLKPGTDCIRAPYIARSLRDIWDAMHSPPLSSDFAFDFRPTRHNPGAAALRERRRTLTAWTDETMKSQTRAGRGFIASHICPQRTRAYMGHGCFFFARSKIKTDMWATRRDLASAGSNTFSCQVCSAEEGKRSCEDCVGAVVFGMTD